MLNTKPRLARKKAAYRFGWKAESLCCWMLRLQGFRIVEQRYKTPCGEIDIIAKRGKHIHFIEVKARATMIEAEHAISTRQRQRILQAAEYFLSSHPRLHVLHVHGDAILVVKGRWPRYIRDALTG